MARRYCARARESRAPSALLLPEKRRPRKHSGALSSICHDEREGSMENLKFD